MKIGDIESLEVPYKARSVHDGHLVTVSGYSENDPLGAGGGLLPNTPTVYFEEGGWLLLKDFLENFELITVEQTNE